MESSTAASKRTKQSPPAQHGASEYVLLLEGVVTNGGMVTEPFMLGVGREWCPGDRAVIRRTWCPPRRAGAADARAAGRGGAHGMAKVWVRGRHHDTDDTTL